VQWQAAAATRDEYRAGTPLALPGATRLRVPEEIAATYQWITYNLRAYADGFIGMPATNSLYLWTGQEPPTTKNPGAWMILLDEAEEREVAQALAPKENACAVVADALSRFWLLGRPFTTHPLAQFILREFKTVGRFSWYEFKVRRDRPAPPLLYCVQAVDSDPTEPSRAGRTWVGRASLPALPGRTVRRMAAYRVRNSRLVATTGTATAPGAISVQLEDGTRVTPVVLAERGVDLETPRTFRLRLPLPPYRGLHTDPVVLRLYDAEDESFASVPFLR
jgi:hypothetical protein